MLVFHSPPLTLSKYFKKIYFNFKAWLWGPPPCEVWYCLPPDCCLSDALEDLLKPHWGKPRERKKAPEKQEVFTCSRNTRQNKTKQKTLSLFLLLSPVLPEPTGCCHHCCSPYFSSFSFSSSSSSFLCVQRPEIDTKCLLQWLTSSSRQNLGEHGAY